MIGSIEARLAASDEGRRAMATSRLRYSVLKQLWWALERSGMSQTELARTLRIRKSAVNQVLNGNGNVTLNTLAEYLHALGCEADIRIAAAGELEAAEDQGRTPEYLDALEPPCNVNHELPIEATVATSSGVSVLRVTMPSPVPARQILEVKLDRSDPAWPGARPGWGVHRPRAVTTR